MGILLAIVGLASLGASLPVQPHEPGRPPGAAGTDVVREGDRVRYLHSVAIRAEEALVATGPLDVAFELQWLETRPGFDGDGRFHHFQELRIIAPLPDDTFDERILSLDEVSGTPLASTVVTQTSRTYDGGPVGFSRASAAQTRRTTFAEPAALENPACWLLPPPARDPAVARSVLFPHCAGTRLAGEFKFLGLAPTAAGPQEVWGETTKDSTALAWFQPGAPQPDQLAVPGPAGAPYFDVFQIERLERGALALGRDPAGQGPTAGGPIALRPRGPVGLDETGTLSPFPLSQAYAQSLSHPRGDRVRAFLEGHPDATIVSAHYRHVRLEGREFYRWTFTLSDAREAFDVEIAKHRVAPPATPAGPGGPPLDFYELDPSSSILTIHDSTHRAPFPEIPDWMPEFGSLDAHWRHRFAQGLLEGDGWSFGLTCPAGCETPLLEVAADRNDAEGSKAIGRESDWIGTLLRVDGHGRVLVEERHEKTSSSRLSPAFPGGPGETSPLLQAVPGRVTSPLAFFPWQVAAAAGVATLLVSLSIWGLAHLKGLLSTLVSRVGRGDALDHPLRARLLSLIEATPGIHLQAVRRRLNLGAGAALHHLRTLTDLGYVVEERSAGHTCYFVKGHVDRRVMAAAPALKSVAARRVLQAVLERPGSSGRRLAASAELHPASVSYYVKRLRERGLVTVECVGKEIAVVPTEVAHRVGRPSGIENPVPPSAPAGPHDAEDGPENL